MLSAIKHRGNSNYEIAGEGNCCLGANRLEIVDRSNGRQPKKSEDGKILAVLNGEIFNHRQLKEELEASGHKYQSDCDTETLVHLYEQYGIAMLEKLDSEMFAFAIYDVKNNSFFAARDRWGVKPLYYSQDDEGNFYFGSEIKELTCLPNVKLVKMLLPGHFFKDGKLARYYAPGRLEEAKIDEEAAALELQKLVDQAVEKRVRTDLPIGVFLSGGLDSTAILATARKYHKDVTAIIVGKENSEDVKYARRYCEENRVKFIVRCPPDETELFKNIEETVRIVESFEPNVVRQSAISYHIAKAAKELGLRVILCGEGPDELFMGYPEFLGLGKRMAEEKRNSFLRDLSRTQFQRVDRTSMHFTIEVRVPFFDNAIVEFARRLPVGMCVKEQGGKKIEKHVLRKAMEDRLPTYICWREKAVLSEGAGYKGNQPGGLFEELASAKITDGQLAAMQNEFPEWNIRTKEEAFYFGIFRSFGYGKAHFNAERVVANRIASVAKKPHLSLEEQIFHRMTDKRLCRFHAKHPERLREVIRRAMGKGKPIELFMLWGVWKKETVNGAESTALEIIDMMQQEVQKLYQPGFRLTVVMADTHATLNLMDKMSVYGYDSYLGAFERYARARGHAVVRLSEIRMHKPEPEGLKEAVARVQKSDYWPILVASAGKYYDGKDKEKGAKEYVERRLSEKPELEQAFRNAIFLTYNGPRYDALAPDLPTLYPIANRKRTNEKPWFALD
ncbi:MAG: asparagine synthase-related protein [Candidatus Micrarchaeia archaeon]|jgi:asparagine synthase (glutamine-hydrolysing)